jgi:hypothetical protein
MPIKEWANWSIFKDPGQFNIRHFAEYGRQDEEIDVIFNKVGAVLIPLRLLPNVDKAIKVLEESDLAPPTKGEREFRERAVRRAVVDTDFIKRFEKAKPSAAAEKKRFLKRAKETRQGAQAAEGEAEEREQEG